MTGKNSKILMYLMPGELTPAQQEQAFVILRNTTKSTRLDRFLCAVRKVGTPIQPCADVQPIAWMAKASKGIPAVCRDVTVNVPYDRCNYDDLVFRTDLEARLAIRDRTVNATMRALDAKTGHYLSVRNERDALKEQIAEKEAEIAHLRVVEAKMHLLEEVCAFYANDEDRFIKADGNAEPYGMIPTDVGMKARSARARFMAREQAAQDAGGNA